MKSDTVWLDDTSNSELVIKMTYTGLLHADYNAGIYEFSRKIKQESGIFPDAEPDELIVPGIEKENIGRRFELNSTLGAIDPVTFPNWKVACQVIRKGNPDVILKTVSASEDVSEDGTFGSGNLTDSKIVIYFSKK